MRTALNLQPTLFNEIIVMKPLEQSDFEEVYLAASDPLIWQQHPDSDRFRRDIFQEYFDGAMKSKGAFTVLDACNREVIGCTRYYDYSPKDSEVYIGWTFLKRSHWGGKFNGEMKKLLIDHAFTDVTKVKFHIDSFNRRSQEATKKMGAKFIGQYEQNEGRHGPRTTFIFEITAADWCNLKDMRTKDASSLKENEANRY